MPIDIRWYNEEKTILYFTFTDPWTWEDFFRADHHGSELVQTVDHEVCFLADFSQSRQFPRGMSLQRVRNVLDFEETNSGMMVAFGVNPFLRVMLNTMMAAVGRVRASVAITTDLKSALEMIDKHSAGR